ncbi:MAG: NfeD family protein [Acidobacteriota bacterium]
MLADVKKTTQIETLGLFSLLALLLATPVAQARDDAYVRVLLEGEVNLGMSPLVQRAVEHAETEGVPLVLEINTLGGRVDAAIVIRDAVLKAEVPTVAWVNPRAISAGALIALAAETIDIAPGGTIGAATPITTGEDGETTAVDEKFMSYMRREFAATAEARDRDAEVAEAMVDRTVAIEGLIEEGKLLTLSTSDALRIELTDRSSAKLDELLESQGWTGREELTVTQNWTEKTAAFLTHQWLSGLLLTVALVGLVTELRSPGFGVPGSLGLSAIFLFFVGHQVVHLAGWEDALLVAIGLVLLAVEAFITPGFGVAGILGLGSLGTGLVMAMISHDWELALVSGAMFEAVTVVAGALFLGAILSLLLLIWLPGSFLARPLVLDESLDDESGSFSEDLSGFVGHEGKALTPLRPAGTIEMADGRRLDALTEGGLIEAESTVTIVGVDGASVVVRERTDDAGEH